MTSRLGPMLGDWDSGTDPLSTALAERIRLLILDGRIPVGERLPSERVLALELGRSRATMTRAYERLSDAGFLDRRQGSGTRATLPIDAPTKFSQVRDGAIDFTMAAVPAAPGFHAATLRALDRLPTLLPGPGYSLHGIPELRAAIADRYTERGLATTPEQIVVTSGAMHAITLVVAALGRRGSALVEQPAFPHATAALRRAGHRLIPSPVTSEGWDVEHLTRTIHRERPSIAYLIPDFHNPTSATMPEEVRAAVTRATRATDTLLIGDETCTELDIDRGWTPRPLAAYGAAVLVGSMSKISWGGMRIGWIRASREHVSRILAIRPSIDLGTSSLEQCVALELLSDSSALRDNIRTRLRRGRDAVADGIPALPGVTMPSVPGGLAAWIELPFAASSKLSLAARDHGLIIPSGPSFGIGGAFERFTRIPISLDPEVTSEGLRRLSNAWHEVMAHDGIERARKAPSEPLAAVV
ncbi:PLP-dependent aminotransferase family protein [Humidisolicoccus flavus]|uniref:MocR-like transcription factor YczR n=1 Tax=Humidisolicoccus flavus TaxID=3111414 RepID=UPI00325535BB